MMSSIADSTIKQYSTAYRLWWEFCQQEKIPLFEPKNSEVITFLQQISQKHNYKYGAINSHRSALSLILSADLGSDPLIKRFMKGMSRLRPTQPRYSNTWDPHVLLSYLEDLPEELNLLSLSQKLVTLLALSTGSRLQTLSLIRLSNISESRQEIQINITDPIKTSGLNKEQPTLHLPFFEEKPKICVARTLQKYIQTTQPFRKSDQDWLFLTIKKPHSAASKQTLSKWVKQLLSSAGIDVSKYKPHSTRHSATSAALRQGVSLETICRTAGWSEHSATFAKFYKRPLSDKTVFAKTILSLSKNS